MLKALKFTIAPLSLAFFAYLSFTHRGLFTYSAFLYAYALIPILEFFLKNDARNFSDLQESMAQNNRIYDLVLYLSVGIHLVLLCMFLFSLQESGLQAYEITGRILSMGLLTTFAINLGHELGHRQSKGEQFLAKVMLLTSLMMHFFIEHNRGHHKNVATLEDPSTARKGETVYAFWIRAIINEYFSAWRLEKKRLEVLKQPNVSLKNEMIQFQFIQLAFLFFIFKIFGGFICLAFMANAAIAYVSFETVQYLEHYGLLREKNEQGHYKRVRAHHSWNSNHVFGRLMMFNLSRHSDHHYRAAKKYQILKHHDDAPQLPTGYPGMMILSLLPPLWFRMMNPKLKALELDRANVDKDRAQIKG
jgi:alkane 1-monooxygenase